MVRRCNWWMERAKLLAVDNYFIHVPFAEINVQCHLVFSACAKRWTIKLRNISFGDFLLEKFSFCLIESLRWSLLSFFEEYILVNGCAAAELLLLPSCCIMLPNCNRIFYN